MTRTCVFPPSHLTLFFPLCGPSRNDLQILAHLRDMQKYLGEGRQTRAAASSNHFNRILTLAQRWLSYLGIHFRWRYAVFMLFFSYASMQQTLPLAVCFMLEVGGPSWCHGVQRAEPERGPLLAAGARVVPVLRIHRHRTGKRNGTGQKAQLTKLNRLACCCHTLFRPNAPFRTLSVIYVSGTNQNRKNMELFRRESWFWLCHALSPRFEEKQSDRICSSRVHQRRQIVGFSFSFLFFVLRLDTCKGDAFEARLF